MAQLRTCAQLSRCAGSQRALTWARCDEALAEVPGAGAASVRGVEQPRPEDKSWTWVLERPCPDCGFDVAQVDRDKLGARLRANAAAWRAVLGRGDIVSQRPPDDPERGPVWSALEYGCHSRDVYRVLGERLRRMLTEDTPRFADWDQDDAAREQRYHEQDPARVSYDLAVAAGKVADMLDRVGERQWDRPGVRSDGTAFTVESLAAYLLHDVQHHLHDAEAGYEAIGGS
jgi:hypothetical protein